MPVAKFLCSLLSGIQSCLNPFYYQFRHSAFSPVALAEDLGSRVKTEKGKIAAKDKNKVY